MKILLTGASGMLGHHLMPVLQDKYDVLSPTRNEMNCLDYEQCLTYMTRNQPDLVVHMAAVVGGIAANIADPVGFYIKNQQMNFNVIQASFNAGIQQCLNIASSCMYPKDRAVLHEEDLLDGQLEPTNEGYALSKITATKHCQYLEKQFGMDYKTLVPCNLYGEYDSFDPNKSHLLPAIIRKTHDAMHASATSVTIWGSGKVRREFMHASDLASCIDHVIPILSTLPSWVNVGVGKDHSVNTYYQTVARVMGYTGQFEHDLTKPEGMAVKLLNSQKIQALGWQPKISLDAGISRTVAYYQHLTEVCHS